MWPGLSCSSSRFHSIWEPHSQPDGIEGWPHSALHIAGRGLCPCEVRTVIQLFSFEDHFVAPPPRLDPLCIVIKVLKAVPVHLLEEIIQEDGVLQRVLLFYEMPLGSIPLHVSGHGTVRASASSAVTSCVTEM